MEHWVSVDGFSLPAAIEARITWNYAAQEMPVRALYEKAVRSQWNALSDIDWSLPVEFGSELPDDAMIVGPGFEQSPLASRGRCAWDIFRWEFQAFMVCQFLHGEQGALLASARLAETLPGIDGKLFAASQATDEARHVEVFARYLNAHISEPYSMSDALAELLADLLTDKRWDITALGMQLMVEAVALAAFRMANSTFHDPLIKSITKMVAQDESRHLSFGILCLDGIYKQMTAAERSDREDFVLEAARNLRERFLLDDVWDRLDVDLTEGRNFAMDNSFMADYRRTVFSRVIYSLTHIGLLTPTVQRGMEQLGLMKYAPTLRSEGVIR